MTLDELRANVDTIVILIMENRSFDHVLGHLKSPAFGNRPDVEGIDNLTNLDYLNPNTDGEGIAPFWMNDGPFGSDLPHDAEAVQTQIGYSSLTGSYMMNGFVKAYEAEFHSSVERPPVMGLLRPDGVPTTGALAARYTVCDHWFACLPTSTAPNRLMSMCGYTNLRDTGSFLPDQTTVYDWLLDHQVRWRVYSAGLPFFLLMPRLAPLVLTSHFRRLGDLPTDLATEAPGDRPQVIFIEPDYFDSPVHFQAPCDNHAPLAMAPGEAFLAQVYDCLTRDRQWWSRMVFIVTYDEHGGFFDHMAPLPVKYRNPNGVSLDSTGPRVPAIVAGPFATERVDHTPLDNTSVLQLLAERFGHPGETYSAEVAGRMHQGIASVSTLLSVGAQNANIGALPVPGAIARAPEALTAPSDLRRAFASAATALAERHGPEAYAKYGELKAYMGGKGG